MIILGIDPGTATTGYGIIRIGKKNQRIKFLSCGCVKTLPGVPAPDRLKQIYNEIAKIIKKHNPEALAIESLYFFKNAKTAIPVSQAKGVVLLAAAKKKMPIYEFTPLQVKVNIVGYGRAEKKQVQQMVKIILQLKQIPRPDDAADALGVAITLAYCLLGKKHPPAP
jgi:crossover junction endodeoxyribonuclease RuvC